MKAARFRDMIEAMHDYCQEHLAEGYVLRLEFEPLAFPEVEVRLELIDPDGEEVHVDTETDAFCDACSVSQYDYQERSTCDDETC